MIFNEFALMDDKILMQHGLMCTLIVGLISLIAGGLSVYFYVRKNKYRIKTMIVFLVCVFMNFIPLGIMDYLTPYPIYEKIDNFKNNLLFYAVLVGLCGIPLVMKGRRFLPLIIIIYCLGYCVFIAQPIIKYLFTL